MQQSHASVSNDTQSIEVCKRMAARERSGGLILSVIGICAIDSLVAAALEMI